MNSHLATLADASSLLLGIDRKLTRVDEEPGALPAANPIPAAYQPINSGFGETTRARRNVVFSDGGFKQSTDRIESAHQYVPFPVCDGRPTIEVLGNSSRLQGRSPMLRRTT
jgi:hypothetical protein